MTSPDSTVPDLRIRALNDAKPNGDGDYILYWMIAHRRPTYNFALQRARDLARQCSRPLLILEGLRVDYPWACERHHAFVLQGMADNRQAFADVPATYYPYVETANHKGTGLIESLARRACAVVTDDFPAFFLPRMIAATAARLDCAFEAVDSNGILPLRATDRRYKRAYHFRRYVHDTFLDALPTWPEANPLSHAAADLAAPMAVDPEILSRWPMATDSTLAADPEELAALPIDHEIKANPDLPGGWKAARRRFDDFMDADLARYHERQKELTDSSESRLSPYLHFGHISPHRLLDQIFAAEDWSPSSMNADRRAKREGFWRLSAGAEEFIDQLVTWREIGFNRCALDPDGYADYDSLPDWAIRTLADHADDPREHLYSRAEFEAAKTHDELWNAAQRQLVQTGEMHNYLRMLWGKKILHWSPSPQEALATMIELNNKYALDGRDPNSYGGIFWILGRFDRAWGPEREIFGKVRYMTSDSTRRKFRVDKYLQRFGDNLSLF